ncbi:MAG: hypothetical protein K2Z81_25385 [Cyanobacteria bacterium]|nr:hypothetical protein [Cyanobacteriota bacterium]
MQLSAADKQKLIPLLERLIRSLEDLVYGGLTVASESTRQTLAVSFQEASRMGLLRLGSTIRAANDELGRFTSNDPEFSPRRLNFFINRSWLLSQSVKRALTKGDDQQLMKLLWVPERKPIEKLEAITLGTVKRVTKTIISFDFHMRTVSESNLGPTGQRLVWTCMFPVNPSSQVPPEGYLHLPQKQKFNAVIFLEPKILTFTKAFVSSSPLGTYRLMLDADSTVANGDQFSEWSTFLSWSPKNILNSIRTHKTGPLDLEIELQDEVVLSQWSVGSESIGETDERVYYPLHGDSLDFHLALSKKDAAESKSILSQLTAKQKVKSSLFGLLHFENCKLVFQPLSLINADKPTHLQISDKKIDRAALVKTLRF